MKNKRYILMALLVVVGLILASCSSRSHKKIATAPKPPPPLAKEKTPAGKSGQTGIRPQPPQPQTENPSPPAAPLPVIQKNDLAEDSVSEKNGTPDKEEASVFLEEGLSACQEAQAALDKEEIDVALAKLDEAYGLILKVNAPPDSPLCQEKNDLRLLIAQRLQQIYASHLKSAGNNNGTIPLVENNWVQAEIRSFQNKERRYIEESYKRSGIYRPMIVEELKKAGLPEQLSWLPIIESGFKVRALSRARALGMWQFIRSTGYRYGLKQDKYVDERMDPLKATQAAIKYLAELHDFFGDWTTALASYNCGEMRVQNVIRAQKIDYLDNFWDLFNNLPYETGRFVPRFIAALVIIENPEKYGFSLPAPDPPLAWEVVTIRQPVKLASLSSSLELDPLLLPFLNPELRHDSTPDYDYALKVPVGCGEKVLAVLPLLPRYIPPEAIYGWHIVKRGETIGILSVRYRTSVSSLMRLNGIRDPRRLQVGQRIKIPGKGQIAEAGPAAPGGSDRTDFYTVKEGDTLYSIARSLKTTVDKIKADNGLENESLSVGQKLLVQRIK